MCLLVCTSLLEAIPEQANPYFLAANHGLRNEGADSRPEISHLAVDCSTVCLWSRSDEAQKHIIK